MTWNNHVKQGRGNMNFETSNIVDEILGIEAGLKRHIVNATRSISVVFDSYYLKIY
ncbi:15002_t:CDS:2 [Gigaspora margarita]|uniref:15002_t:CDS:1 n=1 Tax=Gigaspora margarita TaxID=4874 RepID=A0ABN7V241_GIGMA|nr:15002_t:CDS:2 [Gigaspora margarita]